MCYSQESNPAVKSTLKQATDLVHDLDHLKAQIKDIVKVRRKTIHLKDTSDIIICVTSRWMSNPLITKLFY